MSKPTERFDYRHVIDLAIEAMCSQYALAVSWAELLEGVTGDLDGARIIVDSQIDDETALYVLLHLFGHTAQWNVDEAMRELGHQDRRAFSDEDLRCIQEYEKNASRIGLSLLIQIGYPELREWISRWFWADWAFLRRLYRTGDRTPVAVDWTSPAQILDPIAIPAFTPHVFACRQAFD